MHTTVHTAMKMSSVAMRDWAIPRVSAAANASAMRAQVGERPSRRASGYTHARMSMPAMTAGTRHPKARSPKTMMPRAMANLPISGCGQDTSSPPAQRSGGLGWMRLSTIALASLA